MQVCAVPKNYRGFDCNVPLSADTAARFATMGYRFAIRYVPRIQRASYDLTLEETARILQSGLAIMAVQHVELGDWTPDEAKGTRYGQMAGHSAILAGILPRTSVWLDLESVKSTTAPENVIAYCNAWYDQVLAAGFLPGLYIGWQSILTPDQLYHRLKFTRYWAAYNLNSDQIPAVVGICMKQGVVKATDRPPGCADVSFDTDLVLGDANGRFPMVTAPDTWNVSDV